MRAGLLVVVVVAVVFPIRVDADDVSTQTVASSNKIAVAITCTAPLASNGLAVEGSGFVISFSKDSAEIVTAAHVITHILGTRLSPGCAHAGVILPFLMGGYPSGATFPMNASDCQTDTDSDIAACPVMLNGFFGGGPPTMTAAVLDVRDVIAGSAIAFTGYPLGTQYALTAEGHIAGTNPQDPPYVQLILDRTAWPGSSGSPIYDARGNVLGMVLSIGTFEATGLTYGEASSGIADFLANHKIAFGVYKPKN